MLSGKPDNFFWREKNMRESEKRSGKVDRKNRKKANLQGKEKPLIFFSKNHD